MECGLKPPGTYRIVMLGSSQAAGVHVQRGRHLMEGVAAAELSRQTGRKVELYNEGMWARYPHVLDLSFNEVLAAQPT